MGAIGSGPSAYLLTLDDLLPRNGCVLDVAGGSGRNAIWLAQRGLDVTVADISDVALELVRNEATVAGVGVKTVAIDLEREPFPAGPWDLIMVFHFLRYALFPAYAEALRPGGLLVLCLGTRTSLQRRKRPSAHHLVEDGELPSLVTGLEILHYEEGWLEEDRHDARLVARKPANGQSVEPDE
ncbi:MAG: class I SAM-dependent methyltransferase [Myxococcota bacterium]